jgi:hypothetical protein
MANKTNIKGVNTGGGCDSETAQVTISRPWNPDFAAYLSGDLFNLKPTYSSQGNQYEVKYNGSFWYLMGGNGGKQLAFANPGNENYPWEATWPSGYGAVKRCEGPPTR